MKASALWKRIGDIDKVSLGCAGILSVIGIILSLDAGYARSGSALPAEFRTQLMVLPVAIFFFAFFSQWNRDIIWKAAPFSFLAVLLGLGAVLSPLGGHVANGAGRWLGYGPIRIQPAEFAKLGAILFLAWALTLRKDRKPPARPPRDFLEVLDRLTTNMVKRGWPAIGLLLMIYFIEKQPDLGTASVVAVLAFAMFYVGGVRWQNLLIGGLLALLAAGYFVRSEPYRLQRFTDFENRWSARNMDDSGYQTVQSEIAMADGGLVGTGIGTGRAKYLVPEATSDFMMTTLAEEFGLLGTAFVMLLLGFLCLRILARAQDTDDKFARLVCVGTATWLGVQGCVNLLQANGRFPAIGIPFPFVSAGGSSLLSLWLGLGVVESTMRKGKAVRLTKAVVQPLPTTENLQRNEDPSDRWRDRRPRLPGS